jgi:hypothetical protein
MLAAPCMGSCMSVECWLSRIEPVEYVMRGVASMASGALGSTKVLHLIHQSFISSSCNHVVIKITFS